MTLNFAGKKQVFEVSVFCILQLCVILEPMQELMSRHKAYALSPRDCLKTTLFQKWQKMVAPPGKSLIKKNPDFSLYRVSKQVWDIIQAIFQSSVRLGVIKTLPNLTFQSSVRLGVIITLLNIPELS